MNVRELKAVHLVGAGGINMSAVGKLLLQAGVKVSGSDLLENEQTKILAERGATITIGEAEENVPEGTELLVVTSAAPATNKERMAAAKRGIPEMNNFAFLGKWFAEAKTYVVTGTHGKSTTTAMLGLMLEKAGMDPTVIVGSKVTTFPDGNVRMGKDDLLVIEGDEYARHFLEFHPSGVVLNNLELDHVDVFRNIEALISSFHELVEQVKDGGTIVANVGDERLARLIETERDDLARRSITVIPFGGAEGWTVESAQNGDLRNMALAKGSETQKFNLSVPGHFNALNAAGAVLLAHSVGVSYPDIASALESFRGIWRRFEFLGEVRDARVYSDYGHHPTAVEQTLKAARESFPGRRILLCFQPHHRNRTKSLFLDFVPSFDEADALVLCEIYDVAGRDAKEDEEVSSRDLADAVVRHDADRDAKRPVEFAEDPQTAVQHVLDLAKPDDIVIVMGAGDIDNSARGAVKK